MSIRIGTIFTGTVDRVGEQSVQTKFFMIGVPLIPLESYFVLQEQVNGVNGIRMELSGKSVLMAYARWGSFVAAIIAGIAALTKSSFSRHPTDWLPLAICGVVFVASLFFGGLSKRERARRSALKSVTGLAALPEMLPLDISAEILSKLEKSPVVNDPMTQFALELYRAHVKLDVSAGARAENAWSRIEASPGSVVWA